MTTLAPLPSPFIPLNATEAARETVGGKGANLVKLTNAGFPVPHGFLIPTAVYREFVDGHELGPWITAALQDIDFTSPDDLDLASAAIRARFSESTISSELTNAIEIGWGWLDKRPVAVRSSATAEDLPELSFAGQQDSFLNVTSVEALCQAILDCWSSLWTARAIGYRARSNISHEELAISVVVQNMVQSEASGVLFTANPLNGRRTETVIDATLGLGEALVGGLVEPDHYVVDTQKNSITNKSLGGKSIQIHAKPEGGTITQEADSSQKQAVPDLAILRLAKIGKEIESLYAFPQDIEWAYIPALKDSKDQIGPSEKIFILQSRPITSLYPLPENLPAEPLKTMIGLHLIQGMMEPFTPLGQTAIMEVLLGCGDALGIKLTLAEQTAFYVAGGRIWLNVTPIVLHPRGHKAYPTVIKNIDPGMAQAFEEILQDPRLAPRSGSLSLLKPLNTARFILPNLLRVLRIMRHPESMAQHTLDTFDDRVAETAANQQSSGDLAADFAQRVNLLLDARTLFPDLVIPSGVTAVVAGMVPFYGFLQRFSREVAERTGDSQFETLYLEIARGLPNNVTTEMDLSLWQTAQALQDDPESATAFEEIAAAELADQFKAGKLPTTAQDAVAAFITRYGMRGLGEIDIGRPRWREDPEQVMGVLKSYLQIDDPSQAPDAVFARGEAAAQAASEKLIAAVRQLPLGWIKAHLVRFAVRRYRALGGLREAPKFFAIRMMGVIREGLLASGSGMVSAGLLGRADDLFYLYVAELESLAADLEGWKAGRSLPDSLAALQPAIIQRRQVRARELHRGQIPRVLLSDGTAYYEGVRAAQDQDGQIVGDPVSPGVVEGIVRVVLDPQGTQLEPGEILVCPGTDPAWTPLFLSAGGLVMETGGMMTHGSVVAREYGIPAVVGVHQATEKLQTGYRVKIDGASGQIQILEDTSETVPST